MIIKILKLNNGTEVIAEITKTSARTIETKNPLQINYRGIQSDIPAVMLSRYIVFSADKAESFKRGDVMNVVQPMRGMEEFYKHAVNNFETNVDKIVETELANATETTDIVTMLANHQFTGAPN